MNEEEVALNAMQMHKDGIAPLPASIDMSVPTKKYSAHRATLHKSEKQTLLCEFWLLGSISILVGLLIFVDLRQHPNSCNIMAREWILVAIAIWIFWRALGLSMILVNSCCFDSRLSF